MALALHDDARGCLYTGWWLARRKLLADLCSAGQFDGQGDHHSPKPYVRKAFEKYLECSIFAHGFARAWDQCIDDLSVQLPEAVYLKDLKKSDFDVRMENLAKKH